MKKKYAYSKEKNREKNYVRCGGIVYENDTDESEDENSELR